jgi:molybdate transport system substrate-binding protein
MRALLFALTIALAVLLGACGGDDDDAAATATLPTTTTLASVLPSPTFNLSGTLTVFAASSLTEAFTEIGQKFEVEYPVVHVEFNFAGSQDLETQLEQGASADVFASAAGGLAPAAKAGVVVDDGQIFAGNRLAVIVPKANEAGIATLQDLAKAGLKIVLANEDVPVGKYARQFLDNASNDAGFGASYKDAVLANVVSEEANVKQVAAKVQLGEADAGIVYKTDVTPELAQHVTTIEIPDAYNVIASYPIAQTTAAQSNEASYVFIQFVLSSAGQDILAAHGFMRTDGR